MKEITTTTATTKELTARDFYEAILKYDLPVELIEYATKALNKLDARKAKPTKAQLANMELKVVMATMLGDKDSDEFFSQAELGEMMEITPQKAGALARALVADGRLESIEVKTAKGKCKGYRAVRE